MTSKEDIQARWNELNGMTPVQFRNSYEIDTDLTEWVGMLSDSHDNFLGNLIDEYMQVTGLDFQTANAELLAGEIV